MGRNGNNFEDLTMQESIDLRRDSQEKEFITIVKSKVYIDRKEMKKQKFFIRREMETFNFLQYIGIIYDWAMTTYKISRPQVDYVLYLAPLAIFTREEALKSLEMWPLSKYQVLERLSHRGMIYRLQFSKDSRGYTQPVYALTNKATTMVNIFYKKVMGKREFATGLSTMRKLDENTAKGFSYEGILNEFNQMVRNRKDEV
jgi:hypothetical protein